MEKFEEYLDMAKDIAQDAGEIAKTVVGEVVSKARELTDDGRKVKELAQTAKDQAAAISLGVRKKMQGMMQDAKASKDIALGIAELEALPEIEGSILYTMELQSMISSLKSLMLIVEDKRLDDASVAEEIKKVIVKVEPAGEPQGEEASAEEQAIEKAKSITFNACIRALDSLGI